MVTSRTKTPAKTRAKSRDANHTEEFREAATAARENVREMGGAARGIAADQIEYLAEEIDALKAGLATRVEHKPMQSLMIAAGAGVLLGLFLRR